MVNLINTINEYKVNYNGNDYIVKIYRDCLSEVEEIDIYKNSKILEDAILWDEIENYFNLIILNNKD